MKRVKRLFQTKADGYNNSSTEAPRAGDSNDSSVMTASNGKPPGQAGNVAEDIYPTIPPRLSSRKRGQGSSSGEEEPRPTPLTPAQQQQQQQQQPSPSNQSQPPTRPMRFIPQERGREETLAWLDTGTCESLKALLTHRDQAARQIRIRRGPRTLGNREVQAILREPSRRSVQRLHDVILGVEMDLVYGSLVGGSVTAVFHYNFSRAVGWNKNRQQAAASSRKVPSLQLREMVPAGMAAAAAARRTTTPSVGGRSPMPIRWLQLPTDSEQGATPDIRIARSWTPLSELGGWREEDEEEGGGGGNDIADYKRLSDRTILGSVTDSHNSHTHNNNYENSCGEEPLSSIDGWREEGEHKHSQVVCNTFSSTTSVEEVSELVEEEKEEEQTTTASSPSPARLATKAEAMAVTIIRAQVRQVDVSNSIAKPTE